MDMNLYCMGMIAHQRLRDMRDEAARVTLLAQVAPAPPLRVIVGQALVGLGNRLMGGFTAVRATG